MNMFIYINWTKILRKIVEDLPSEKVQNNYYFLMTKFEDHERSQLPPKDGIFLQGKRLPSDDEINFTTIW